MTSQYTNTRRSAQSATGKTSFEQVTSTHMSAERKKMVPSLSFAESQLLNHYFKTEDGKTEADDFLTLTCVTPGKEGRVCVETDTAPRLVADRVTRLGLFDASKFAIPIRVIHRIAWMDKVPLFDVWLLTRCRYPTFSPLTLTLSPQSSNGSGEMRTPSTVDMFEVYLGVLSGTMAEFFAHGEEKAATNVWRIVHTMLAFQATRLNQKHKSSKQEVNQTASADEKAQLEDEQFAHFCELVRKRDGSVDDAIRYKKFLASIEPRQYHTYLLRATSEQPDISHRSRVPNLDFLLLGAMALSRDELKTRANTAAATATVEEVVVAEVIGGPPATASAAASSADSLEMLADASSAKENEEKKEEEKKESPAQISSTNLTQSLINAFASFMPSLSSTPVAPRPIAAVSLAACDVPSDPLERFAGGLLRAVLERAIRFSCVKSLRDFVDRAALVQFVTEELGSGVESTLKYYAFIITTLRQLFLAPAVGPRSFIKQLKFIRESIREFKGGIAGLALLIDPNTSLTDETLAEIILTWKDRGVEEATAAAAPGGIQAKGDSVAAASSSVAQANKFAALQFPVIQSGMGEESATPVLNSLLLENVTRIQKLNERLEQMEIENKALAEQTAKREQEQKEKEEAAKEASSSFIMVEDESAAALAAEQAAKELREAQIEARWNAFATRHCAGRVEGVTAVLQSYVEELANMSCSISADQEMIEYFIARANELRILGTRRSRVMVRRFVPRMTDDKSLKTLVNSSPSSASSSSVAAVGSDEAERLAWMKTRLQQLNEQFPSLADSNYGTKTLRNRVCADMKQLLQPNSKMGGKLSKTALNDMMAAASSAVKASKEAKEAAAITPVTFVRFELARAINKAYALSVAAMCDRTVFDCAVCFEESRKKPVVLHGEYRHAVCESCATQLEKLQAPCPFCREDLYF